MGEYIENTDGFDPADYTQEGDESCGTQYWIWYYMLAGELTPLSDLLRDTDKEISKIIRLTLADMIDGKGKYAEYNINTKKSKKFEKNEVPKANSFFEGMTHKARWGYAVEKYGGLIPGQHEAAIQQVCELTGYSRSTVEKYWSYYRNNISDEIIQKFKPAWEDLHQKYLTKLHQQYLTKKRKTKSPN